MLAESTLADRAVTYTAVFIDSIVRVGASPIRSTVEVHVAAMSAHPKIELINYFGCRSDLQPPPAAVEY